MFAELLRKEAGYCKGKGGSMHIADPATGNLGAKRDCRRRGGARDRGRRTRQSFLSSSTCPHSCIRARPEILPFLRYGPGTSPSFSYTASDCSDAR